MLEAGVSIEEVSVLHELCPLKLISCNSWEKGTMDMMPNKNVRVLDWPARSPDLNPIEHL